MSKDTPHNPTTSDHKNSIAETYLPTKLHRSKKIINDPTKILAKRFGRYREKNFFFAVRQQ